MSKEFNICLEIPLCPNKLENESHYFDLAYLNNGIQCKQNKRWLPGSNLVMAALRVFLDHQIYIVPLTQGSINNLLIYCYCLDSRHYQVYSW